MQLTSSALLVPASESESMRFNISDEVNSTVTIAKYAGF